MAARPHRLRRTAALAVLAALVLPTAGCSEKPQNIPKVTGEFGSRPQVAMPSFPPPEQARMKVLSEGDGPVTRKGQVIVTDVDMRIWESGRPLMDTYRLEQPTTAVLDGQHVSRTWDQALLGRKAGSRVLLVSPATHGFGPHGMAPAQVTPTDHMVLVFDVIGGYDPKAQAAGPGTWPAGDGFPSVRVKAAGAEPVLADFGAKPEKTRVRTLAEGKGPVVKPGSTVVLQYTGVEWGKKTPFNSTYLRNGPNGFVMKDAAMLPGWFEALDGKRVGSRLLVAVPDDARPGFTHTKGALGMPKDTAAAYVLDVIDTRRR
ncbi:FKBP-type peptidyl-prolyl cis-trans isomerase [Streptomyces indicus]|uniref:Peptidyl-prolyl cis-trans isomerase n=1 Tax=Streptomyces indicus TaxID=417292 RepID=A0A1G9CNX0_9ACTN|nr:FKBP-type peptidyl-prolyl cis-trans isomerase [Streptomyces indicus]SDK53135.1 peptidylprolyl isomerase [Streptomyces indicus]